MAGPDHWLLSNTRQGGLFCLVNNSYRTNSIESYRAKPSIVKSCSSNLMKNPITINTSRVNTKNNFLNIYTPINMNNQAYNSINNSKQSINIGYKKSIIYKKKK